MKWIKIKKNVHVKYKLEKIKWEKTGIVWRIEKLEEGGGGGGGEYYDVGFLVRKRNWFEFRNAVDPSALCHNFVLVQNKYTERLWIGQALHSGPMQKRRNGHTSKLVQK